MIEVKNLSKSYDTIRAVDNISFNVDCGDTLGFLGPNGAGKSTTMKIITGFVSPTSGDVKVCDKSISDEPIFAKEQIGYVPENAPLYEDLTVYEFLHFVSSMRKLDNIEEAIESVVPKCALQKVLHQNIGTLSKGFRRRVSLAQALIHNPKILILDEPTDGLDPNQKHEVRALIKSLAKNKCIIISTHILEEVDAICNRAIIISEGKKLFDGSASELKEKSNNQNINDVFRAYTTGQQVQGVQL